MNLKGHVATGVALAVIGLAWCGGGDAAQAFVVGAVAGSVAPDLLEVPVFVPGFGFGARKRLSLIPHRTWTHWWPFWLVPLAVALVAAWPRPSAAALALGFGLGGLLHLAMDLMTPMGLPVTWPPTRAARRKSLFVYRNGEFIKEWGVVAAVWAIALASAFGPGLVVEGVERIGRFVGP